MQGFKNRHSFKTRSLGIWDSDLPYLKNKDNLQCVGTLEFPLMSMLSQPAEQARRAAFGAEATGRGRCEPRVLGWGRVCLETATLVLPLAVICSISFLFSTWWSNSKHGSRVLGNLSLTYESPCIACPSLRLGFLFSKTNNDSSFALTNWVNLTCE